MLFVSIFSNKYFNAIEKVWVSNKNIKKMISAILEFMTVAVAVVAIRSVHTGLYLTITNRGELQGTVSLSLAQPAVNFSLQIANFKILMYFSLDSRLT